MREAEADFGGVFSLVFVGERAHWGVDGMVGFLGMRRMEGVVEYNVCFYAGLVRGTEQKDDGVKFRGAPEHDRSWCCVSHTQTYNFTTLWL